MNDRSRDWNDYLDGDLEGEALAEFREQLRRDPSLAEELALQARIDAALRRRFSPPAGIAGPASIGQALPGPASAAGTGGLPFAVLRPVVALAAAALILVVAQLGGLFETRSQTTQKELASAAGAESALPQAWGGMRPVPLGEQLIAPDLEALYADAQRFSPGLEDCETTEPAWGDLGQALSSRHGALANLKPEAARRLNGPFSMPEWPSGTVLTGFPRIAEDQSAPGSPSVLIAETEERHRCCLLLDLPMESELQVFTLQVGDLFLTELTPRSEPSLLQLFE